MIRYAKIRNSYWYSLNDIKTFLVKKKAIPETKAFHSRMIKLLAKIIHSQTTPIDANLWIGLAPDDLFISKYGVSLIREICSERERLNVSQTHLLSTIDFFGCMKGPYPEVEKQLKKVKLVSVNVGKDVPEPDKEAE